MRKNTFKQMSGITLIALVVTIVITLILAGISIAALTGENGLISNAIAAKDNTRGSQVKEQVERAVLENEKREIKNQPLKTRSEIIEELQGSDSINIGNMEIDFSDLGD